MYILDIAAAFIIAVLTGMGIGSGGLFVIYLTMIRASNQVEAQGLNLAFILIASAASLIIHFTRRKLRFDLILVMSFFGVIGAIAGSFAVNFISADILRKIFGGFLIISGTLSLLKKE